MITYLYNKGCKKGGILLTPDSCPTTPAFLYGQRLGYSWH